MARGIGERISKRVGIMCWERTFIFFEVVQEPKTSFLLQGISSETSWTSQERSSASSTSSLVEEFPLQNVSLASGFGIFSESGPRELHLHLLLGPRSTPSLWWLDPRLVPIFFKRMNGSFNYDRGKRHDLEASLVLAIHKVMRPLDALLPIEYSTRRPHAHSPWCNPEQLVKTS